MNYHMGLLGDKPSNVVRWLQSTRWDKIPPEVLHDFHVTLLTPGFPARFWSKLARMNYERVIAYKNSLDVTKYMDEALKNYESITEDDVMLISKLKPRYAALSLPLALRVIDDVNKGMTQSEVADKYNTTRQNVHKIVKYPGQNKSVFVPDWFKQRMPGF